MTSTSLLRGLYSLVLTISIPALYLRLLWRSQKNPSYRARWLERLGIFKTPATKNIQQGIWIHAVSVGESIAAVSIIQSLMQQFPSLPITVTTGTPNGSARIQAMLRQEILRNAVFHVYFPFDLPWTLSSFLKRVRPKLCVVMETELWPNALMSLRNHNIPVIIANGRLSPRSFQGYQRIKSITQEMMSCLSMVAAQSKLDGDRFLALGLQASCLEVTGNVKFDMAEPSTTVLTTANELRQCWGAERPVWIAASTHEGEEEMVLDAFMALRKILPKTLLILVPRHIERRDSVIQSIRKHDLSMVLRSRSDLEKCSNDTAVFLVDTMGEMPLFYQASDVAFVGGSLVPVGGHNTLEPALASRPMIVGPYVHNFTEITKLLLDAKALQQVHNTEELARTALHLLTAKEERILAGQRGRKVVEENRGAVEKVVKIIATHLTTSA